jgi:hypothetical protein
MAVRPRHSRASSRCGRFPVVIKVRRATAAAVSFLTALFFLVLAPAAMAADGVGLAGRVDDRFITYFCFAIIAFFAAFVTIMSLIQAKLDAKKEQRRHDLDRFNS